jgi:hypothetical protein
MKLRLYSKLKPLTIMIHLFCKLTADAALLLPCAVNQLTRFDAMLYLLGDTETSVNNPKKFGQGSGISHLRCPLNFVIEQIE